MKKFLAIAVSLLFSFGIAFAADTDSAPAQDSLTRTIVPENQHVENKTASVRLEYTPLTDEVIAYYKVLAVSYDPGEAMNAILECLNDFKMQNQYDSYKHLHNYNVKYFKDENGLRWAEHREWVKFNSSRLAY